MQLTLLLSSSYMPGHCSFIGAHFRPGFLFVYIIMGSSVLTLQLMIVAVLWIEPQHVVDRIVAIDERDGIQDYSR